MLEPPHGDVHATIRLPRATKMTPSLSRPTFRPPPVPLPSTDGTALTVDTIARAFHAEHEKAYGFHDASAPIELGTLRLAIVGDMPEIPVRTLDTGKAQPDPQGTRRIFLQGAWTQAAVCDRGRLCARQALEGPAIVTQEDTTTLVLPGWHAETDSMGNLHVRPAHVPHAQAPTAGEPS
ncbi:hypothetical protein CDEF62S_00480 [Castellaniella defragrans]